MTYSAKSACIEISADTMGAELHSIKLNGTEYLWQCGDSWKRYAPILFPFICNSASKTYKSGGIGYTMPTNHGFARDSEFKLIESGENFLEFALESSEQTLSVYPYKFRLIVRYEAIDNKVCVTNTVHNIDDKSLYFYLGSHPAFNCPLEEGLKFDDYKIVYEKAEQLVQDLPDGGSRIILDNNNSYPLSRELFDYDVILKDKPASKSISLCSDKGGEKSYRELPRQRLYCRMVADR